MTLIISNSLPLILLLSSLSAMTLLADPRSDTKTPMPTDYDDFSERAHRDYIGNLSAEVIANRKRLADVMQAHGFTGLPTEWWHFDANGWERFPLLDIALE